MKKRTAGILLGIVVSAAFLSGCSGNKATEAANESAETEKEGNGEDPETEAAQTEGEEEAKEPEEEPLSKVGVLLPEDTSGRWSRDASVMQEKLEEAGYEPRILYANDDVSMQVSQIQQLIEEEVSALIVSPVDAYSLPDALAQAKEKSIPVFSYDRLIMDSDAVSYYTAFDTREVGQMIGNTIVKEKELEKAREDKTSSTIEFLMGSPDDGAALFLYNGIMEVLQPYLDDGTLVCKSQQTTFDDTSIMRWSKSTAKANLAKIMTDFYAEGGKPDIICTAYDGLALGAMEALEEAGFRPGSEGWPLLTGVGSEADSVKHVAEGKQQFSIFLDSRVLAEECVTMVDTYLKGEKPEVKDYEQYDNGKKIIGTYTCDVQLIDQDNYQLLIDNGYYTQDEIEPEVTPTPAATPTPAVTPEASESEEEQTSPSGTPTPDGTPVPSAAPTPGSTSVPDTDVI